MGMTAMMRAVLGVFLLLTLLTGVVYPLLVTGVAQVAFPGPANGSLLEHNGRVVGSALLGQPFTSPRYFWGRPSVTEPHPYNAASSSASHLSATSQALAEAVAARVAALRAADPGNRAPVPVDLVTASGSGLDPHISRAAAEYQVERVARARGLPASSVRDLVQRHAHGRTLGVLGEPRVDVLALNLALDEELQ